MGQYINPPSLVEEKGKGLSIQVGNVAEFKAAQRSNKGLLIVGWYDRGIFQLCPVLDDEANFLEFESQYERGLLVGRRIYAFDPACLPSETSSDT
jgi:hypothetical protein